MRGKGLKGEWAFVTDGNVVGNLTYFRRKIYLVTQFLLGKCNRHFGFYRAEIKELFIVTDGQMDELITDSRQDSN